MIVLIDASNLAYKAHFTTGELSYQEKQVGVLFGFLKQLLPLAKEFKTNQFVFLFDSRKSLRKAIYPNYKNRSSSLTAEDKDILYGQINELKEDILVRMGFANVVEKNGYEADDLIAHFAKVVCPGENVIVSTDNDLYQLLAWSFCMYNTKTQKKYKVLDFEREWGIECTKWSDAKAIAGCDSDTVEGVTGVGLTTAIKYLKGELKKGKKLDAIESSKAIIKRNMKLVHLPFKGPKALDFELQKDSLTAKKFLEVFDGLRFNSFTKKENFAVWKERFNLK